MVRITDKDLSVVLSNLSVDLDHRTFLSIRTIEPLDYLTQFYFRTNGLSDDRTFGPTNLRTTELLDQ